MAATAGKGGPVTPTKASKKMPPSKGGPVTPKKASKKMPPTLETDEFPANKPPPMPDISEPRAPFSIGKSRVYTCGPAKAWRVKPDPAKSKNCIEFKWGDSPEKAWKNVVALCKNPKVPPHWKLIK